MRIFSLIMVCSAVLQLHASAPASTSDDGRKSPLQEFLDDNLFVQTQQYCSMANWEGNWQHRKVAMAVVFSNVIAMKIAESNRNEQKKQTELLTEIRDLLRAQQSAARSIAKPAERLEGQQ